MEYIAKSKHLRQSPRKMRQVVDIIRGKNVNQATKLLSFTNKKAATFILKTINLKHLNELKKYKRFLLNVLLKIENKENFTEMICLNENLKWLNRISLVKKNNFDNSSILQLEIIQNKETLNSKDLKNIIIEIQKIFHLHHYVFVFQYKNYL